MALEKTKCEICGGEAFMNARGQILAHTTAATGGKPGPGMWWAPSSTPYKPAEICGSFRPGVRP